MTGRFDIDDVIDVAGVDGSGSMNMSLKRYHTRLKWQANLQESSRSK